ncbi:MAG: nucleoside monophosphate kinase [Candidatus Levybacteria bacterium]|nr:nucleoside monophosphate kinase [Candidatus Levybacteria bacterium]
MVEAGSGIQGSSPEAQERRREIVVICGPEGSGKTTQAINLSRDLNLPYVTMGDVFVELAKEETEFGLEIKTMLKEHRYSTIKEFETAFLWRMAKGDVKEGFILDGGFRTVEQVQNFELQLRKAGISESIPIDVVYFRVAGWEAIDRVLTGNREGRLYDTEEGVLDRLSHHYYQLGERMSYARRKWPFIIIDCTNKTEEMIEEETMKNLAANRVVMKE